MDEVFSKWDRVPLNSKATYTIPGMGLPAKSVDELAQRRADGYISGVIRYDDLFRGSPRHISKFCFVIQPVKQGSDPTFVTGGLCQYWNCVDEVECAYHRKKYDEEIKVLLQQRRQQIR